MGKSLDGFIQSAQHAVVFNLETDDGLAAGVGYIETACHNHAPIITRMIHPLDVHRVNQPEKQVSRSLQCARALAATVEVDYAKFEVLKIGYHHHAGVEKLIIKNTAKTMPKGGCQH
jgi:hypothetical protein